ncbi:MAG: radical SAM protein [Candidatus Brocadiaceae bacterium]|jgi:wyosine [tRNA(Phe)-imidazoG37] synthetase (radical SAM superfamily)
MGSYTYGPVASRRLGRSLGVDLTPAKTCNLNCIYCQLGPTAQPTMERREYVPVADVVREVRDRLEALSPPDYVTLAGSGEPTLHSCFGQVAGQIGRLTDVPLALLTNGALMFMPEVRRACDSLDLVLPSLDAGDEETFQRINRPHPELSLETVVQGLTRLRREFAGQVWLEVLLVEGVNSSDEQVGRIKNCVERIQPHRVQLNAPVRPPAEEVAVPSWERLEEIRDLLGPRAEIIAPVGDLAASAGTRAERAEVLALLRRRPSTVGDVAVGLGIHPNVAVKHLQALLNAGQVRRRQRLYETYYEAASD